MAVPHIISFGEVLWDRFPSKQLLGGAPLNVAWHLKRLGTEPAVVSALGDDHLGDQAVEQMQRSGLNCALVQRVEGKPSGTVLVDLTDPQHPSYTISKDVAWDYIRLSEPTTAAARCADAIVFGSLAQRSPVNQASLDALLAETQGLKIFDVNFRAPYVDRQRVDQLCDRSDIIKVNDAELRVLMGSTADVAQAAREFARRFPSAILWVTCGARGAGVWTGDTWHWEEARTVPVRDTVGCGDAFLAAALAALLREPALLPGQMLARACRAAEWVAQHDGAMPELRSQIEPV